MRFFKENKEVLILLVLLITGENLHLFFYEYTFNFKWFVFDSPLNEIKDLKLLRGNVYYFTQQLGVVTLIPSIYIYRHQVKKASRAIGLGIIIWNLKEFADEFVNLFFGYSSAFDPIATDKLFKLRVLFLIFITAFSYAATYNKEIWNTLSRLSSRFLPVVFRLWSLTIKGKILNTLKVLLKKISN